MPAIDGRLERGRRSRKAILDHAMDIASIEGLESLSLRRLSHELGLSKSGVFAHFGSKEELQIATVRAAVEVFSSRVVQPALKYPAGVQRVWGLAVNWMRYVEEPVFPGGCFFTSAAAEFDARPGRVRDAIAAARRDWQQLYASCVEEAIAAGHIRGDVDPHHLSLELDAIARAGGEDALLLADAAIYERTRAILRAKLLSVGEAISLP